MGSCSMYPQTRASRMMKAERQNLRLRVTRSSPHQYVTYVDQSRSSTEKTYINIHSDVFSYDLYGLVKSGSREICSLNHRIALKTDRRLGNTAAEAPIKFQSDRNILDTNHVTSRFLRYLCEMTLDFEMTPS